MVLTHSYAERQRDYQMIAYLLAKEKEEDERDAAKRDKHKKEALKYREHLMAQMAKASALHATDTRPIHPCSRGVAQSSLSERSALSARCRDSCGASISSGLAPPK